METTPLEDTEMKHHKFFEGDKKWEFSVREKFEHDKNVFEHANSQFETA